MNKNTQIADDIQAAHAIITESIREADVCDNTTDTILEEVRGERDEFRLIRVGF